MKMGCMFLLPVAVGCGEVGAVRDAQAPPIDVPPGCDPTARFGPPAPLPGLEMVEVNMPRLSADELTIYFFTSPGKLWSAHRAARTEAFEAPSLLGGQNTGSGDYDPAVSADGLTLWFASYRVAGDGQHLYVSTRASTLTEFGTPALADRVNSMNTEDSDLQPFLTADSKELWFVSNRTGGWGDSDVWRAVWAGSGFAAPVNVPELNSSQKEEVPTSSADRLTVYFSSLRSAAGAKGDLDIWVSRRDRVDASFSAPALVDELNTTGRDVAGWLSADQCRMYGSSDAGGTSRAFMATRLP